MSWRKSWVYKNIHGNGEGGCKKRQLLPDERSVWDDYLDMATPPNTPIAGEVCYSKGVGLTLEILSNTLHTSIEAIKRANKHMEELKMITVANNGVVIINNYNKYQSEYNRQKAYRDKLQQEVTTNGNNQRYAVDIEKRRYREEKKYIRKEYIDIYKDCLNHWNRLKIIQHKKIPDDRTYGYINSRLDQGYTWKEIKQAMSNYSYIIYGKQFFWTYRWTLGEFMKRGLDKFMDLEVAKKNYADRFREDEDETKVKKAFKEDK